MVYISLWCINNRIFARMFYEFSNKEAEAIRHIKNYLTFYGKMPSVRKLQNMLGYKSPRSASIILENLLGFGILEKDDNGNYTLIQSQMLNSGNDQATTVDIPLLGTVACGIPIYAEENIEAMIPVSDKLIKPSHKYFLLKASGDSMDERGINDGDLVLVKHQQTANSGDNVVALIDNEATIKEFIKNKDTIVLKPHSKSKKHQPIILTTDFRIQGIVESVIKL